jgi:hypothetical protein
MLTLDFRLRGIVTIYCFFACIEIGVGYNRDAVIQSSTLSTRWRRTSLVSLAVTVFFFWCSRWFVFLLVIGSGSVIIMMLLFEVQLQMHGGGKFFTGFLLSPCFFSGVAAYYISRTCV